MTHDPLKATPLGLVQAQQSFQAKKWTQASLAAKVGLETDQSIRAFFSGRPVERHIFIDICIHLNLDWQEIAPLPDVESLSAYLDRVSPTNPNNDPCAGVMLHEISGFSQWVERARRKQDTQIKQQCDGLHTPLLLSTPLKVSQTYVDTEFVTELSHQRWLNIQELEERLWQDMFGSQPTLTQTSRLSFEAVIQNTSRLVVIGNAGSGKTTLLKHLALQCSKGLFQPHCIPLFIGLRCLEKNQQTPQTLYSYIVNQLTQLALTAAQAESLLREGRVQLFLDELGETHSPQCITHNIHELCQQFPNVSMIITHRPAEIETLFPGFHYVEIADFNDIQINTFSRKWFASNGFRAQECQTFISQLESPQQLELKQLARCPLILLGLCIVFQRTGYLRTNDYRLYRTLSVLLISRWRKIKGLEHNVLVSEVELSSLLGWLAAKMLEHEQIFIERPDLLNKITQYLTQEATLSSSNLTRKQASAEILKLILTRTGILVEKSQDIYAFIHVRLQKSLAVDYQALMPTSTPDRERQLETCHHQGYER